MALQHPDGVAAGHHLLGMGCLPTAWGCADCWHQNTHWLSSDSASDMVMIIVGLVLQGCSIHAQETIHIDPSSGVSLSLSPLFMLFQQHDASSSIQQCHRGSWNCIHKQHKQLLVV